MTCERCFRPVDVGEHGLGLCPLEPRRLAPVVRPDDIPGGLDITNGLCHADGSPRRFYSRSAIREACAVKGIIPYHDVFAEEGETRIKDARVHDDWLQSSESRRARRDRDEQRAEKQAQRERQRARR